MVVGVGLLRGLGVSFKAKYFLLLWLYEIKLASIPCSYFNGSKRFSGAFTDKTVRSLLGSLVEQGYIDKKTTLNDKGKLTPAYAINGDFLAQIENIKSEIEQLWGEQISTVLFDFKGPAKRRAENIKLTDASFNLPIDSRILLATLLCFANKNGVVENRGLAELSVLTGMKKDKVKGHLTALKDKGFIHHIVSGVTGSNFLGVKAMIYFLNVKHPKLNNISYNGNIYLLNGGSRLLGSELLFNKQPQDVLKSADVTKEEAIILIGASYHFGRDNLRLKNYLQAFINKKASLLLSSYWDELGDTQSLTVDDDLARFTDVIISIRGGLFPLSGKGQAGDEVSPSAPSELLVKFVFIVSVKLARFSRGQLISMKYEPLGDTSFNIIKLGVDNYSKGFFYVDCFCDVHGSAEPKVIGKGGRGHSLMLELVVGRNFHDYLVENRL